MCSTATKQTATVLSEGHSLLRLHTSRYGQDFNNYININKKYKNE